MQNENEAEKQPPSENVVDARIGTARRSRLVFTMGCEIGRDDSFEKGKLGWLWTYVRTERSRPLLDSLKQWLEETLVKLSKKSETAQAVRYALGRARALRGRWPLGDG